LYNKTYLKKVGDTRYENISKAKAFFEKFDDIRYNSSKGWFEFEFDYNNFTTKAEGTKTKWTICTYGERIETFRNVDKNSQWDSRDVNLSDKFKLFFKLHSIDINSNLKQAIVAQDKKDFFEGLLHLLKLTLQIRNSHTGTEVDYMQSPVMNSNGVFYNSNECDATLPKNADANGAYNIARKGLMIVNRIKETEDLKKLKLAISNKEWLEFAQQHAN
jgi:CRISPR-associated protein Cpf1